MKKAISMILAMIIVLFCVMSCTEAIVSQVPIDVDFIAAYDALETVYEYHWDWYHMDYKYLPEYKLVHHEAVYRVQYSLTYSDGKTETVWREVDKDTYEEAKNEIEKDTESEDAL